MQTGKESKFQNCLYSEVGSSRRGCCCCHFTQRNKEISLELLPALLRLSFLSRRRSSSTPCIRQGLSSCRRRSWNVRTQPSFCEGFCRGGEKCHPERNGSTRKICSRTGREDGTRQTKWKQVTRKRSSGVRRNLYTQLTVFIWVSLTTSVLTDVLWSRLRAWERNS